MDWLPDRESIAREAEEARREERRRLDAAAAERDSADAEQARLRARRVAYRDAIGEFIAHARRMGIRTQRFEGRAEGFAGRGEPRDLPVNDFEGYSLDGFRERFPAAGGWGMYVTGPPLHCERYVRTTRRFGTERDRYERAAIRVPMVFDVETTVHDYYGPAYTTVRLSRMVEITESELFDGIPVESLRAYLGDLTLRIAAFGAAERERESDNRR